MDKLSVLLCMLAAFILGLTAMWFWIRLVTDSDLYNRDAEVKKTRNLNQVAPKHFTPEAFEEWQRSRPTDPPTNRPFTQEEQGLLNGEIRVQSTGQKCPVENCRIRFEHSHTGALISGIKGKYGKPP